MIWVFLKTNIKTKTHAMDDETNLEEEEENINVSGRLAFTKPDNVDLETEDSERSVITLSQHFNLDTNRTESKPIFETGKTWLSKLSSSATYSNALVRRKSSLYQDIDNDIAASPSKPIGHWPDLLVMDKNESCTSSPSGKLKGRQLFCVKGAFRKKHI